VDNVSAVLIGFLALLLIIVVINIINAMFGNNQRKKMRSSRARSHGDMDGFNNDHRGEIENRQRNHNNPQTHYRQSASSSNHEHSHTGR
jgi:hypothetical protein